MTLSIDLAKERADRFRFLRLLYEKSGANECRDASMWDLGRELGLDHEATDRITGYLRGENLLKHVGMGGEIGITHQGIVEMEEALLRPDRPTQHFPPVVNIIQVAGNVVGSQIQQATQASQQVQVDQKIQRVASEFLSELEKEIDQLKLNETEIRDLRADMETIKAQLKASRPKHQIISVALSSIRRILEGVGATLLAKKAAELLAAFV